ncbi:MAG: BspA family leucine-rich repeat surface protein [Methanobrevibacter sp.]|nr:BspA family leucine-rich repeat surface protein [Methanobrevibacter sp.]
MKKIKTYNIGKNTTFDLSKLHQDLEKGTYTIKTQAVSVNGKKSTESTGLSYFVDPLNPLNLPPFTIRCKFSAGYTPTPQGESTGWDSQVCVDETNNIWDITKNSTDWSRMLEFQDDLIEVLGANTTGVEIMFATLNICHNLTKTTLFDTSSVVDMSYMYNEGKSLIECPIYDTSKVTTMQSMFCSCWVLKKVPLFDTSKVENIYRMFDDCIKVESGAYAFYEQASSQENPPSDYYNAFWACGSETYTGQADLDRIPKDWGGNA